MKWEMRFSDGMATISIVATLPLPVVPQAHGLKDTSQRAALDEIETLLPVALSQMIFGRAELSNEAVGFEAIPRADCKSP